MILRKHSLQCSFSCWASIAAAVLFTFGVRPATWGI